MQTFFKPKDKRWVDLAIWCDQNAYKPDCDDSLLYQYLYLLFWMLSHKYGYFRKESDYDEYCLLGAQTVYLRLRNPKQFDGSGKLQPVKSVLNYIKNVAYPIAVNFQMQSFSESFSIEDDYQAAISTQHILTKKACHANDDALRSEFEYCLACITNTIKALIKELPYRNDKVMSHNLYISSLLTILNYLVLDKPKLERLAYRNEKGMNNDWVINELYRDCRYQPPILFHLPEHMANYVATIVNRSFALLSADLIGIIGSYQPSDEIVKAVLSSPLEDYVEPNDD